MELVAHAGNSTTTIPDDLIVEILSRVPAKSIIRFQSVSKQWLSISRSKDLVNTFLTRSTRPRILLAFKIIMTGNCFFFTVPEHKSNENTSTAIARHDMTHSVGVYYYLSSHPVNGFVCFTAIDSSTSLCNSITVCNPITRRTVKLPGVRNDGRQVYQLLGYDPVEDQYKVLCVMMYPRYGDNQQEHYVCTVSSSQKQEWRKIENSTVDNYSCVYEGICIDGAIYYGVGQSNIVRFYVRFEKMELIKAPQMSNITLVNYNGRLGGVEFDYNEKEIRLWILEDVEKQEWSRKTFEYPCEWKGFLFDLDSKGVTHTGELMVFQRSHASKPLWVYYYDFNKESARKVEIQGVETIYEVYRTMLCYPGYVENIRLL